MSAVIEKDLEEKPLPPPPPPPRRTSDLYGESDTSVAGEIDRIRAEELKELQKLREMERRKQAIEEEIAKEKQHLINLQLLELDSIEKARSSGYSGRPKAAVQYETMVARKMGSPTPAQPGTSSLVVAQQGKSPTPPPLPNPPSESDLKRINEETAAAEAEREKGLKKLQSIHNKVSETKQEIDDLKRLQVEELKERNRRVEDRNSLLLGQQTEGFSVDSTLKDLESTTNQLKEFAETHCQQRVVEDASKLHPVVGTAANPPQVKSVLGLTRFLTSD